MSDGAEVVTDEPVLDAQPVYGGKLLNGLHDFPLVVAAYGQHAQGQNDVSGVVGCIYSDAASGRFSYENIVVFALCAISLRGVEGHLHPIETEKLHLAVARFFFNDIAGFRTLRGTELCHFVVVIDDVWNANHSLLFRFR